MFSPENRRRIEQELERAEDARSAGNEGRARVCARRAAGAALREFLNQQGAGQVSASSIDLLRAARELPGLPQQVGDTVERLLQKVDEDFNLPHGWDLIAEARALVEALDNAT